MKSRMCIFYIGVNRNRDDTTGDGDCLDYNDSEGNCLPCRDAITKGYCHRHLKSPRLGEVD